MTRVHYLDDATDRLVYPKSWTHATMETNSGEASGAETRDLRPTVYV